MSEDERRRPIRERTTAWARTLARVLASTGLTPNQISLLSILFSAIGFVSLLEADGRPLYYGVGAVCIVLRLLCNMFDGMVAVEYNRRSPSGEIYNELPDRLSDTLSILGAAYACGWVQLGLWASLMALSTAYVRTLTTLAGAPADFSGPMAKQQRMKLLIGACLVSAWKPAWAAMLFLTALTIILLGSLLTACRRLSRALKFLEAPRP